MSKVIFLESKHPHSRRNAQEQSTAKYRKIQSSLTDDRIDAKYQEYTEHELKAMRMVSVRLKH
ncbi:unnamed protein product, partial [Dovyalis caffra]